MTRVLFLLGLLTLFVACDNANSTTTGKDTAVATGQAQTAQADGKDCACGDKENCKCGDKKDSECGAGKKAHDCGGDCDCAKKHACACAKGKEGGTVWCDKCGVGYIDGKKATDKGAVEKALDKS